MSKPADPASLLVAEIYLYPASEGGKTRPIVYWNTLYMGRAVDHLRAAGQPTPDKLLAHVAPLGWSHISLTGDYLWRKPSTAAETFLPLRLSERLHAGA